MSRITNNNSKEKSHWRRLNAMTLCLVHFQLIPTSEIECTIEKIEKSKSVSFTNLYICYRIRALISANFKTTQNPKTPKLIDLGNQNSVLPIRFLSICLYTENQILFFISAFICWKSKIVFLYFGKYCLLWDSLMLSIYSFIWVKLRRDIRSINVTLGTCFFVENK